MVSSPKPFADQYLEMIALMGKRWVQVEWPTLIPVRTNHAYIINRNSSNIWHPLKTQW